MSYVRRPTVLVDIKRKNKSYDCLKTSLNLRSEKVVYIPFKNIFFSLVLFFSVVYFFFGFAQAPILRQTILAATSNEERAELEAQLADLEKQIEEYESTISKYRQQGTSLKGEIRSLETKIDKINLQIKAANISIAKLDSQIVQTSNEIQSTERSITDNRDNLGEILQNIYETESEGLLQIMLKNAQLSDFVNDVNDVILVQDGLRITLQRIIELRDGLIDQKEILALEKNDKEALKNYQAKQQLVIASTKSDKDTLLQVTQGQESKYQELLSETKKTASEIRNRIFRILGGGELTFEVAYALAKEASDATGIRAALVLAVLDQESALGKNVGGCTYQTAMHPTRDIPVFLKITAELGLDPAGVKVSCPITLHGAYGGAMGPAQFIPSTWNLYKDDIARATGNNPPSPWSNEDAFMATALYLKDSYYSNSCKEYGQIIPSDARTLQERCAAAQYYSGSRWYTYRFIYGEPVVERARNFQKDIDILNGN